MTHEILVVEHDSSMAAMISSALQLKGFSVLNASDPEDALEIIKQQQLSLVLLDIHLPRMNGWEVLNVIHKKLGLTKLSIIAMDASLGADQRRHQYQDAGFDDVLCKPFSVSLLYKAVTSHLDRGAGARN